MNWIMFIWPMVTAACVTIGLIHLRIGLRRTPEAAHVMFALTAFVVAAFSCLELAMIRADSAAHYLELQRWIDFAGVAVVVSMTAFVWVFFGTGRKWLALVGCGLALSPMILNLGPEPKMIFLQITGIKTVETFGGATYTVAEGTRNLWSLLFYGGVVLILVFVADASATLWRRGVRRRSALVGGAIIFFLLLGGTHSAMVDTGILTTPYLVSFFYLLILVAMGMELSDDVLHATQLATDLRESDERLSLAAEAVHLGLWVWEIGRDEFWITPEGRALFGFSADERINRDRFFKAVHPEDRETMQSAVTKSLLEDDVHEREYRVVLPDGRTRRVAVRGRVERDHSGTAVRVRGVAIDVSEHRLAEEKIRESEEFNRTVLASIRSQIAILDRAGTIIAVNDAWNHFALANGGVTKAVGVGSNYLDVCHCSASAGDATARRSLEGVRSVLDGESEFFEMEYPCDSPTEARWFLVRVVPLKAAAGGVVVSHSDITRLKRSELDVQSQREELAHLSRITMLSELSGSLAHELNQPLAIILSNAQAAQRLMAQEPPDLAEVRDILVDIVSEDERAGEVIHRMRAMLKHGETKLQPLVLREVIEEALHLVSSDLISRGVIVDRTFHPDGPRVLGDAIQLQQVLLNLILNACDAMSANPRLDRRITIATELRNGMVCVAVSDSGCGLPSEVERVFEPFQTTKPDGLGLGLSICRTIVSAHQGRLWAEGNAARGATFHIELPAIKEVHS
jgi:two-component system sensor kinase FixL